MHKSTTVPARGLTARTRTIGQCFGTVGQLVDADGTIVAETRLYPYGFEGTALAAISESLNSATVIASVPHYYRAPSAR